VEDMTNELRDFWKPELDAFGQRKPKITFVQAQNQPPVTVEEMKAIEVKPF